MSYHSRQPSIASSLLSSTTFNNSNTSQIHKIGPWRLGKTLGQGSTGRVLLAEHSQTGQKAAVKVVSKSDLSSMEATGDDKGRDAAGLAYGIEREIIIMKLLNHPNVLRLHDVWETSKYLYLILEYVEGGELFDLLFEKGALEEEEAVRFFRQIIMGASYCHALGICHRDLKPENLLLDRDLNVKLADFGMAALETNDRLLETSCGSPHYAAPEIVSGKNYHGFESDVWSCGVILFALLTGRLPFDDENENIRDVLLKVQSGRYEIPDDLSPEAKDLISKMLEVDPTKRIRTHKILEHPLLLKYEISAEDAKTLHDLPSPDSYLKQLNDVNEIDKQILANLITLYHGRSEDEIIKNLLRKESTTEKIFYFLLLRYRRNQSVNPSLLRSLSIAKSINNPHQSLKNSSNLNNSGSDILRTPKKNRRSIISASSSHRKSVSFHRSPHKKTDSFQFNSDQQPPIPRTLIDELKTSSSSSPPQNKNQTNPLQVTATSVTNNRFSITPPRSQSRKSLTISKNTTASNAANKRRSARASMLPNKRNSITSKLLNVYAKMSADSDWNYISKETKRISSDFATLCDEIFDYEEKEKIRQEQLKLEKERLEKEIKEREELERQARERRLQLEAEEKEKQRLQAEKQELLEQQQLNNGTESDSQVTDENHDEPKTPTEEGTGVDNPKRRSVSNPAKSSSHLLDPSEISKIQQRVNTNPFSTRPKSRLDPGLNYIEEYNEDFGEDFNQKTEEIVNQALRRSKFLGSKFDLNVKRYSSSNKPREFRPQREAPKPTTTTMEEYESKQPAKSYDGPKTLAEVKIPQVTRKSRLYSSSNKRLSVLSIYSSRESYTDLASKLRELDTDKALLQPESKRSSLLDASKQRNSLIGPISMIPEEASSTAGLRLSFADRLNALRQVSTSEEEETDGLKPIEEPKKVKLPELPDHFDPLPKKSALKKSSNRQSKDIEIHKDEILSEVLPKANRSEPVEKHDSVSTTKVTPLSDNTNKNQDTQPLKKRSNSGASFFRKWSSSSKQGQENPTSPTSKQSAGFFSSLFNSGAIEDKSLHTRYEPAEMFILLNKLLSSWKSYGLKDVRSDNSTFEITGSISKQNSLGLGSSRFKINIGKSGKKGSIVTFTKTKGGKKGFKMLTNEVERIFNDQNILTFVS